MGTRARLAAGAGAVALLAGGCTSSVQNALDAPIQAIPKTDVVVETNLQGAIQAAQTALEVSGSFSSFGSSSAGSIDMTAGASGSPGQISYAVIAGGDGIVLVGWNRADQHCVGALYVHSALATPVLGESAPGQYYFIAPASSSSACSATSFATMASAPGGWPYEPSTNPPNS
jgi:hypothetical protein